MATQTIAEFNPATGAVTYLDEVYTISQWREMVATERLSALQELNDNRDEASDTENLPGCKPYFEDDWLYRMRPRKAPKGYTFQLTEDG